MEAILNHMDIEKIITDAIEKYNSTAEFKVFRDEVLWYAWPQTWPDTSCGFGGMAGQMFCTAQTVVVEFQDEKEVYVYHGGRYAYHVPVSDRFWVLAHSCRLPGKIDGKSIMELKNRMPI